MTDDEDPVRPFHIWDAKEKCSVRWRYYATAHNAHNAALLIVRWEKVGRSLEIIDVRTGRHHGTYTRKLDRITFTKG